MEAQQEAPQKNNYEAASSSESPPLTNTDYIPDIWKRLKILLRAGLISSNPIAKQSSDWQIDDLEGTLDIADTVVDIVRGLLHHCIKHSGRVGSESSDLVRPVIAGVKLTAEESITWVLAMYDDVRPCTKMFMLCVMMISVEEHPERMAEVVDAILRTWDRETADIRRATVMVLSNAAQKYPAIANEGFTVTMRGLEDTEPVVRVHALHDIHAYAKACPDKAEEVIDAAIARSYDVHSDISSEALRQLGMLYGMRPERDSRIASVMLDKYVEVDYTARASVAKHLADFAESCPERLEDIYVTAMCAYGDEECSVRETAVGQLVKLVRFCPDKEREVVMVVLSACDYEEQIGVNESGANELVNLLEACPGSADRIVDNMCRFCSVDVWFNWEVLSRMGDAATLCPNKAEDIMATVLDLARFDFYAEVAKKTGKTREEVVAADEEGKVLLKYASVDPDRMYHSAKEIAMHQLGQVAKAIPEKAEEIFETVISGWEYEAGEVDTIAVKQMGSMVEVCPGRADQIVAVVVEACGDEQWGLREAGMKQLVPLARVCPERAEEFVGLLCDGCHDLKSFVKIAALEQLIEMMEACPSAGRKLFTALLCCCGDKRKRVSRKAKEQVEAALRLCPEFASDIVLAMIQCGEKADSESRKRQTCVECPCTRKSTQAVMSRVYPRMALVHWRALMFGTLTPEQR